MDIKGWTEIDVSDINIRGKRASIDKNKFKTPSQNGILFVYATWCGHCVAFKEQAAELRKALPKSIHTFKIDSAKLSEKYSEKMGVEYFPTILKIQGGKIVEKYNGERTVDKLFQFLCDLENVCLK
jgi:thiol-disulfide isomerase/thioredoxin